ncbi:MAG: 50S ribosomal protein L20 [Candidatus Pacebacteria bacterium]|nr:50S ribosomal protein L20 [Candidatus Paceibacterota bacterium]
MSRVKRGVIKNKRRRNVLKAAKGFRFGRSTKEAAAKDALKHAGAYAFKHRKLKKRENRGLWQTKIASAAIASGTSFSKTMGAMKKKNYALDRKVLAYLAEHKPETMTRVLKTLA